MTKRTDSQTSTMGFNAQSVLENEAYVEAMELLRKQIYTQWMDCPIRDKEGQTILLQLGKLTDKFESVLAGLVESGKMAQAKIDLNAFRDESAPRQFMRRAMNG